MIYERVVVWLDNCVIEELSCRCVKAIPGIIHENEVLNPPMALEI